MPYFIDERDGERRFIHQDSYDYHHFSVSAYWHSEEEGYEYGGVLHTTYTEEEYYASIEEEEEEEEDGLDDEPEDDSLRSQVIRALYGLTPYYYSWRVLNEKSDDELDDLANEYNVDSDVRIHDRNEEEITTMFTEEEKERIIRELYSRTPASMFTLHAMSDQELIGACENIHIPYTLMEAQPETNDTTPAIRLSTANVQYPYGQVTFPEFPEHFKRYVCNGRSANVNAVMKLGDTHRGKIINTFPTKHPMLETLCFSTSLPEVMPTWWIQNIQSGYIPEPLRYQLEQVTLDEFKQGMIDANIWKNFRNSLRGDEKNKYPQSPKLGGILASLDTDNRYTRQLVMKFTDRGENVKRDTQAIISTSPIDLFYMSNGQGWDSCQHFCNSSGSINEALPSNFFDPNVAIAYVKYSDEHIGKEGGSLIARTTLRLMYGLLDPTQYYVTIGRMYGNNEQLQNGLYQAIIDRCHALGYKVGCVAGYGNPQFAHLFETSQVSMYGVPYSKPTIELTQSYLDGLTWENVGSKKGLTYRTAVGGVYPELETT